MMQRAVTEDEDMFMPNARWYALAGAIACAIMAVWSFAGFPKF